MQKICNDEIIELLLKMSEEFQVYTVEELISSLENGHEFMFR